LGSFFNWWRPLRFPSWQAVCLQYVPRYRSCCKRGNPHRVQNISPFFGGDLERWIGAAGANRRARTGFAGSRAFGAALEGAASRGGRRDGGGAGGSAEGRPPQRRAAGVRLRAAAVEGAGRAARGSCLGKLCTCWRVSLNGGGACFVVRRWTRVLPLMVLRAYSNHNVAALSQNGYGQR